MTRHGFTYLIVVVFSISIAMCLMSLVPGVFQLKVVKTCGFIVICAAWGVWFLAETVCFMRRLLRNSWTDEDTRWLDEGEPRFNWVAQGIAIAIVLYMVLYMDVLQK